MFTALKKRISNFNHSMQTRADSLNRQMNTVSCASCFSQVLKQKRVSVEVKGKQHELCPGCAVYTRKHNRFPSSPRRKNK